MHDNKHLNQKNGNISKHDKQIFDDNHQMIDYLKESRLFNHLPDIVINEIVPLSNLKEYIPGEVILEEGIVNDKFFLLISGEVGVFVRGENILTLRRKGDIFGEMSVISKKPTTASIVASSKVSVITIQASDIVNFSEPGSENLRQVIYPIFAMILTDKLSLTTYKAQQYELTNRLLEETKTALEAKIRQQKETEKKRKKLEQQLLQSQKMESLGTLAGGIAHDFNNILQGILLSAELANKQIADANPAKSYLERTLDFGHRAKDLVAQILTFSRQKEVIFKRVKLQALAEETCKMVRSSLPSTIELKLDIQENLPDISGDETQIQQIIVNLCSNAGHALNKNGGVISISLKESRFDTSSAFEIGIESDRFIKLVVRDNGPGIPHELINKIFDPFFTTKPVGEGTGLGLSVIMGIIHNHHGNIFVESEPGKETSFTVYLPIMDIPEEKVSKAETIPEAKTAHILLIDDEEGVLLLHKDTLELLGYQVVTFCNSLQALEYFKENGELFDLVLTDQTMPAMSGLELSEKILQINPNMKIILMSGQDKVVTRDTALMKGINEFIIKPFSIQEIHNTIQAILN